MKSTNINHENQGWIRMKFGDLNGIEVRKIQRVVIITYTTFRPSSFIYASIGQIFYLRSFLFLLKFLFKSQNMFLSYNVLLVIVRDIY